MADSARIVATYTAAADHFDALPFWHHFGRLTVERLHLPAGARVVDLCCGTGASALPAAEHTGPTGHVLGVDLTPALVAQAKSSAAARGLTWAEFQVADVAALALAPGSVDAVVSVFGLFFLDDMAGALRRAWTWLAPGGQLAVTVWGKVVLAPGEAYFWDAVRREDPSLEHISPAGKLAEPGALEAVFAAAGVAEPTATTERWRMPLASPEAFWPVIMGTSSRGVFEALSPEAQSRVRERVIERLRAERVDGLDMEALVATVGKPRSVRSQSGSIAERATMTGPQDDSIATLVARADEGDGAAKDALFAALYADLHRLAQSHIRRSGGPLTLGATTLLHEAYLNFADRDATAFPDRNRFLGYASRAMRGLVINYIRNRQVQKRGGALTFIALDEHSAAAPDRAEELEGLSAALDDLAVVQPDLAELVDLKFFCGFTFAEIAAMRAVSERTIQRDWAKARLLLHRAIESE